MTSTLSATQGNSRAGGGLNWNIILLLAVSFISFLVAEQIIAGWLPLGERINVSRRDFNLLEITTIVGSIAWGLVTLRTAWGFIRHERTPSIRRYFSENTPMPPGVLLAVGLLGIIGIFSLVIAEQVLTGWLPLGERVNISRRDINFVETLAIIGAGLWGLVSLRTVFGFVRRDARAWAVGQWVLLLTALFGIIFLMSGVFEISGIIPRNGTFLDNMPGVLPLVAPGLLIFLSAFATYRYMTKEMDTRLTKQNVAATLEERALSRDTRALPSPADQAIRNSLARSPGAGAIIGLIAILIIFSVASDLFLEPRALAGALSTNITRGVVAIGITILMISGEFDLSVGSLLGVSGLAFLGLITGQLPMIFIFIACIAIGFACFTGGSGMLRRGQRTPLAIISTLGGLILLASSVFIVVQAVAGQLPENFPPQPPILSAILALSFAGFLGYVNGTILIRTGIPSFIVTLGTLLAFRAIPLLLVAEGRILRYADYFGNTPPTIAISRWVLIGGSLLLSVGILLIARTLLVNQWQAFRGRLINFANDPSDYRDLFLIGSFIRFAVSLIAVLAVLYILVGGAIEQFGLTSTVLEVSFFDLMNGRIEALPFVGQLPREINLRVGVFWWFLLVIIFQFILNQTRYGNATFAVGGNPGAARAQGINTNRVKVLNFIILAVLVGVAAIFDVSRVQSVDALRGEGLELEVIAASVIGGTLLTGGYGSIFGALLGVFIFGILQTGLVLVGMNPRVFNGVIGVIIIIAVVINTVSRRTKS